MQLLFHYEQLVELIVLVVFQLIGINLKSLLSYETGYKSGTVLMYQLLLIQFGIAGSFPAESTK